MIAIHNLDPEPEQQRDEPVYVSPRTAAGAGRKWRYQSYRTADGTITWRWERVGEPQLPAPGEPVDLAAPALPPVPLALPPIPTTTAATDMPYQQAVAVMCKNHGRLALFFVLPIQPLESCVRRAEEMTRHHTGAYFETVAITN